MNKKYLLKIKTIEIKNKKIITLNEQIQEKTQEEIKKFLESDFFKNNYKEKTKDNKKYYYMQIFKNLYQTFEILKK